MKKLYMPSEVVGYAFREGEEEGRLQTDIKLGIQGANYLWAWAAIYRKGGKIESRPFTSRGRYSRPLSTRGVLKIGEIANRTG